MIEINKMDEAIAKILKEQRLKPGIKYKKSQFTIVFNENGKQYILHTLHKQCLECDGVDLSDSYLSEEIADSPWLKKLMECYYYVPEDKDECASYVNLLMLIQTFEKKQGAHFFTILPTLGCNARCIYCFEEGMKPVRMTSDIVDATVEFILRERRKKGEIYLSWFGGEPLLEVSIIDNICKTLTAQNIPFSSIMVTNASLVTDEVLDKMVNIWNLKNIQISVDGDEKNYIKRKRYIVYDDEYHKVINAIGRIAERGIQVSVRCNVDEENVDSSISFIYDLEKTVRAKENVSIHFGVLHQVRGTQNDLAVWSKTIALWDAVLSAGFKLVRYVGPTLKFRQYHCMADEGNIVIAPDGNLYPCEHCPADACFGNVKDGITHPEIREEYIRDDAPRDECKDCPYLPECTPFRHCPIKDYHCREQKELQFLSTYREIINIKEKAKTLKNEDAIS